MEKFYFFNSFLDTARAIEDDWLRLKYLMAVAEYWIEGKESNDPIIKALMVQTKFTLDRSKELSQQKSEAMRWNQNAVKNFEKVSKQRKTDKNRLKQKKQEEEVEEEVEEENNLITNSNELVKQSLWWNMEISNLIEQIKQQCDMIGIEYDKQKDRYFAKFILTAKEFWEFAEKIWQTREEFALNILKASYQIKFRKGICAWPMRIYQNYAEVYNETLKQHSKNAKNLIQSF